VRRITADSNIYISALNFGGKPLEVLGLARAGEIELAISNAIITEVSRIWHHKFYWKPEDVTVVVQQFSASRSTCTRITRSTWFRPTR
jgi:predicted nucleic acid-binding protein